jgi:hypothetical protein
VINAESISPLQVVEGDCSKLMAKHDHFSAFSSYFSDNKDLLAERGGFEPPIQLLTV